MLCSVRRLKQTIPRERQADEVHITFRVIKCQGICLLLFYYVPFIFFGIQQVRCSSLRQDQRFRVSNKISYIYIT